MKKAQKPFLLLIFVINFSILFCKLNSSDRIINKPDPPILVSKSDESAVAEKGIDAVPGEDAIFIEWHSAQDEILGWKIYKKEARVGSFQFLTQFSKNDTSFIDANVEVGIRYEYYLTAVGFKNQESAPSDTAVYKLLNKAVSLGNTLSQRPVFEWHYSGVAPVLYILRLLENPANTPIWIAGVHPGYQGQQETALYNFDGTAAMDSLQKNKTYAWRVDEIGSEASSGSESNWKVFTVPK